MVCRYVCFVIFLIAPIFTIVNSYGESCAASSALRASYLVSSNNEQHADCIPAEPESSSVSALLG